MVQQTSQHGFALGVGEVTLPSPLFEGDTLYADTEVLEARESRSRKGWGIVTVRQRGIKQDGTVVLVAKRTFMVPTRDERAEAALPRAARVAVDFGRTDEQESIRSAVRSLCAQFPGEYWREPRSQERVPGAVRSRAHRCGLARRAHPDGVRRSRAGPRGGGG